MSDTVTPTTLLPYSEIQDLTSSSSVGKHRKKPEEKGFALLLAAGLLLGFGALTMVVAFMANITLLLLLGIPMFVAGTAFTLVSHRYV